MYVPSNWQTGDLITADKLNNIETGVQDTEKKIEAGIADGSINLLKLSGEAIPSSTSSRKHQKTS